ncbi:MAG TPA: ribosome biogenesis GTP-binding protein YihA/YsxC [Bacillota bacterium]|nr:ribosome biogenesis GTP-binding protein YihA/YsxC [Bacillota bacterium]
MKVNDAEIVISAVSQKQYPDDHLPEIALAGRSNVGKSSFINKMINRRALARTSSKPGKTQTINFYKINQLFYFVDVPGYGYAKVSKQERNKWGAMMEEYFETRETLKVVVLVTDLRHEPTRDDRQMFDYVNYLQLPMIVLGTKLDKIPRGKRDKHISVMKKSLQMSKNGVLIPFSAETGEGVDEMWSHLRPFISE